MSECRYVFILGTGRIGSLSLAKTFQSVKTIHSTHEKFPKARHISNRLWDKDISRDEARKLIKQGLKQFDKHKLWLDSNCLLWNFVDILDEETNGQAVYIYVKRNRDKTIESLFNTGFCANGKMPWTERAHRGFMSTERPDYNDQYRWINCELCYDSRTMSIEKSLADINFKRQMIIKFEPMVSLPTSFRSVCDFISKHTGIGMPDDLQLLNCSHPAPPKK
jgi:hypothetical protein